MDFNKPWGWQQPKAVAPMGNSVAPLASSAASMPDSVVVPEDPTTKTVRAVGTAVGMQALDNAMKPAANVGSAVQDSATKAALYSDVGYGAPLGEAAAGAGEAATTAATDVAADAAADTAGSAVGSVAPFAGVLKEIADGNYVGAGAQAAGTAVAGPLGGLAAKYATKLFGFAEGTTSVPAPVDRAATRAAAGARFAPELFRSVNAPGVNATNPIGAAIAGGKGGATAPAVVTQPAHSIVAPVAAPVTKPLLPFRPFFNPAWENVEVGGA